MLLYSCSRIIQKHFTTGFLHCRDVKKGFEVFLHHLNFCKAGKPFLNKGANHSRCCAVFQVARKKHLICRQCFCAGLRLGVGGLESTKTGDDSTMATRLIRQPGLQLRGRKTLKHGPEHPSFPFMCLSEEGELNVQKNFFDQKTRTKTLEASGMKQGPPQNARCDIFCN